MTYLIKTGRWSGRIKKHLRPWLAARDNQNEYVNWLIEWDMVRTTAKDVSKEYKPQEKNNVK